VVKDRDLLGVAVATADQDILVMEAITTRLDAVKLRLRAKMMRMVSAVSVDIEASQLELAADVLDRTAAVMDQHLKGTSDPLAELRSRLAHVRRREMRVAGPQVDEVRCLAFPEHPAPVAGCNCQVCSALASTEGKQ
jgi:hypothetical protein